MENAKDSVKVQLLDIVYKLTLRAKFEAEKVRFLLEKAAKQEESDVTLNEIEKTNLQKYHRIQDTLQSSILRLSHIYTILDLF